MQIYHMWDVVKMLQVEYNLINVLILVGVALAQASTGEAKNSTGRAEMRFEF